MKVRFLAIVALGFSSVLYAAERPLRGDFDEAVQKLSDKGKNATNGPMMVEVGDDAVKLAAKFPKKRQEAIDLASEWYGKAWPSLDDVWKAKLRDRLARLYAPVAQGRSGGIPAGWSGSADTTSKAEVSGSCVHTGVRALSITPSTSGKLVDALGSPSVVVKGGKSLEFSAWVLSNKTNASGDKIQVQVTAADGRNVFIKEYPIQTDTPIWTKISETIVLADGATQARASFLTASSKGFILLDDVSFKLDGKELLPTGGFER